jgi:hypothetical protein
MQSFQYQIKPRIARVLSNKVRIPYFSFGEYLDDYAETPVSQIRITFRVEKDIKKPEHLTQKFHFFLGQENTDELYYERPLGMGIRVKMHCKNLLSDPEIVVNSSYHRFIRSRIDSAYPPGVHVADILCTKLLEKDYSPMHCAAISYNGEGILLAAPPDTGKSLTTLLALRRGYGFLSEDIAIVDKEHIYSNPTTATFYHTENLGSAKSLKSAYFNFLYLKIPVLSYFLDPPNARIYDIMKDVKIDEKVPIKNICILNKGSGGLRELDSSDAARRLLIINRNEFSYHKNTLLFASSYFNPQLSLAKLMNKEEEIISTLTKTVKSYLISTDNPREYIELIEKSL